MGYVGPLAVRGPTLGVATVRYHRRCAGDGVLVLKPCRWVSANPRDARARGVTTLDYAKGEQGAL